MHPLCKLGLISALLLLGAGVRQQEAEASFPYPSEVALKTETQVYEAPNERAVSDLRLSPQTVYIRGVEDSRGTDGVTWYLVNTWRGDKWIRLRDEDFAGQEQLAATHIALLAETPLYDRPDSGGRTRITLSPQTVPALAIAGSFYKIDTWLGEKWIRITGDLLLDVRTEEESLALTGVTPVFDRPDADSRVVAELTPQEVAAYESAGGWYHIPTWLGPKWVNPRIALPAKADDVSRTIGLTQETKLYRYPSFESKPLGIVAPQQVKVVGQAGNWVRIQSDWLGDVWLYPVPDPSAYRAPVEGQPQRVAAEWKFRQLEIGSLGGHTYPLSPSLQLEGLTLPGADGTIEIGAMPVGEALKLGVSLTNTSKQAVTLTGPAEFELQLYRMAGERKELVWKGLLPPLPATSIPGNGSYFLADIPWNQNDLDGNQVPQGSYLLQLHAVKPVDFVEASRDEEVRRLEMSGRFVWQTFGIVIAPGGYLGTGGLQSDQGRSLTR
ncbi:hypothetical protein [Paenibacillus validus]|uniref:Uncharacterized protein n=1 Tax=Paenibacillus validus TaxID=44253 RepID=A0A7X3CRZ7_9BACL|nr:hypothetical protein [Paenibacillus validus]MUG69474.1 hypothetical protein [Paenibacillus validus]